MAAKIKNLFQNLWAYIEDAQMSKANRILSDYKNYRIGSWE